MEKNGYQSIVKAIYNNSAMKVYLFYYVGKHDLNILNKKGEILYLYN